MNKVINILRNLFGSVLALIYFVTVMLLILFLLFFYPFVTLGNIKTVIVSGFSNSSYDFAIIGGLGLFIGISLLIPPFRRMYYALPWLFSFVKIMYMNMIILCVAVSILNFGFEVQSNIRHIIFIGIMIVQIILSRLFMCWYLYKRPVQNIGGDLSGK